MRILIAGASGAIGRALVRRLRANQHEVFAPTQSRASSSRCGTREGDMGDQVRQQQVPIIGEGQGVNSFVHIDDAAGATAAALSRSCEGRSLGNPGDAEHRPKYGDRGGKYESAELVPCTGAGK